MKKYFLTGNKNKFNEIAKLIDGLEQLSINGLYEIQSLDIEEIIRQKLTLSKKHCIGTDALIIVEDTGLYLKSLNGFPGPLIKYFLESVGNAGIYNICDKIKNYDAEATTSFGLYDSKTESIAFHSATIKGKITPPKGDYGFGWDPIFTPDGTEKTFAEMDTIEEKSIYSMRYKALQKLLNCTNNK